MRAGVISWQLAQTFWVGGLWLLQFVMLPALAKIGLAPLLIEEVAGSLQPLLVGFTAFCVLLQALVLIQLCGLRSLWRDLRGQLLLAVLLLAGSHLAARAGIIESPYWLIFSYLAMGMCGLILVLQVAPGRER
ncbi:MULTISPECIES: hypothetical protein [Stutzerimonas]|uniref:DUF4149 domain-containing protein n=2 Tax=Stutzerimonas xanthomarina TaxID=271420 RepID=A0A1M5QPN5_9GAMM|nr:MULTISPECIES: hypothetical protein [Stutzerimonas]MCP9338459.1 DUF4149 domain-containing protein [Stutzerimonas xanthomarina]SEH68529.1 hypothetical protein SAMN05216535_1252 [Stutzerimonas xanthomarina]SHH16062.1 hypothetical protein SAMN02744645_2765 [Stutzerimonas xanthomarina DSM 18231]